MATEKTPFIIDTEGFKGWNERQPDTEKQSRNKWKDLSTIIIVPCYSKGIHPKIVQNWMNIMAPMNQKFMKIFVTDMEVGAAYSQTIEQILITPGLNEFKYIFTLEHDNTVQPDVLMKLYPHMETYDAVGAIYYTKGIGGAPMCYGNPVVMPVNFIPFQPPAEAVQPCRGLGMGATLFKLEMFKNPALQRPLFETVQKYTPGVGVQAYTQDLRFFEKAGMLGYKFACSTQTQAGHMEIGGDNDGYIW